MEGWKRSLDVWMEVSVMVQVEGSKKIGQVDS